MAKLNVDFKNGQITVKSKLQKSEQINERELSVFQGKMIRGLMRPVVRNYKKIDYTAPIGIYLKNFLQNGITQYDFFLVIAQIAEAINKIEYNEFSYDNLLLDIDYIFINERTKEIHFVYQPIMYLIPKESSNVFSLLYQIVNFTQLQLNESEYFLNEFVEFLRSLQYFDTKQIEDYILQKHPQVYSQVKRQRKGDSKYLKDKLYDDNGTGYGYESSRYSKVNPEPNFNQPFQQNESKNSDFNQHEPEGFDSGFNNAYSPNSDGGNMFNGADSLSQSPTPPVGNVPDYNGGEGTTVLDDGGTSVLNIDNNSSYPYLIRLNNYERVDINKPSFRIGKERSYVDYFVMNNSAVSRIHADIITRSGRFFIKDNNSTNRTFVNGSVIPFEQEVEIFDGDAIMLANEPFEFHIN